MSVIQQLLIAINYMHKMGIAHRDIRLYTLFMQTEKKADIMINVLGFGLSYHFETATEKNYQPLPRKDISDSKLSLFRAPETF